MKRSMIPIASVESASTFRSLFPSWAGYTLMLSFASAAIGISLSIAFIQKRFTFVPPAHAGQFSSAGRSVKPFLISSAIVSSWTWSGTLVQSSVSVYLWGIAAAFWFAAGATVQIVCFSFVAVKIKQCAPHCTTFLEVVYRRYGASVHCLLVVYALLTNLAASTMLPIASSNTVHAVTGTNVYMVISITTMMVSFYTLSGGLRVSIIADYTHNIVMIVVTLLFFIVTFATSSRIGSPDKLFSMLQDAAVKSPAMSNHNGSYLTLRSNAALAYGAISFLTSFGTLFNDQGYWQRAIAARPRTALRAFIFGGIAWFAIPFCFATTMGLAAIVLRSDERYPSYPEALTIGDLCSGLAAPAAAFTLLGHAGTVALLLALLWAVFTSLASEMIAVSSILTRDIYQLYLHSTATDSELIHTSRWCILLWGCIAASASCVLKAVHATCLWIYCLVGVTCSSTVPVLIATLCWKKQSRWAALIAPIGGSVLGVTAWLSLAYRLHGTISIVATVDVYVASAGVAASVGASILLTTIISLIWPDDFDFAKTQAINAPKEGSIGSQSGLTQPSPEYTDEVDPFGLVIAARNALWISLGLTLLLILVIPLPLYLTKYELTKATFRLWVACAGLSVVSAFIIVVVMPIIESRSELAMIIVNIWHRINPDKPFVTSHDRTSTNSRASMVCSASTAKTVRRDTNLSVGSPATAATSPRW